MYPKNPDPSKKAILRTQTPAMQVQPSPLEGPKIPRVGKYTSLMGVSENSGFSPQIIH